MTKYLKRRSFLMGSGALLLAGTSAFARKSDVDYEMRQVLKGAASQPGRITLGLPRHSDAGTSVPLTLSIDSAMTEADFPEEVHVYGTENPRPRILTAYFTPRSGRAELSTRIRLDGAQAVSVIARMKDGSFWTAEQKIGVTFGACAQVGSGPGMDETFVPVTRVSVPPTAAKGDVVKIRTLISHPMEPGLRLDAMNQFVPLRIIEQVTAFAGETEFFRVVLEPAISTNPYLEFYLRVDEAATLRFEWLDTTGQVYKSTAAIAIA